MSFRLWFLHNSEWCTRKHSPLITESCRGWNRWSQCFPAHTLQIWDPVHFLLSTASSEMIHLLLNGWRVCCGGDLQSNVMEVALLYLVFYGAFWSLQASLHLLNWMFVWLEHFCWWLFFFVVLSKSLITSVILKLCIISCSFPGKAEADGSMHVTLCDYIMLWDSLSATQKKSLSQRYQMGCDCKVRQQKAIWVCLVYLPGWKENGSRYLEVESRHNRQKEPMFYPLPSGIWFRLSTFSLFLHQ